MNAEIECLECGAKGFCHARDIEGNSIEANDDDLADICEHLAGPSPNYRGTGEVEYD